jgi:hypothetical protein
VRTDYEKLQEKKRSFSSSTDWGGPLPGWRVFLALHSEEKTQALRVGGLLSMEQSAMLRARHDPLPPSSGWLIQVDGLLKEWANFRLEEWWTFPAYSKGLWFLWRGSVLILPLTHFFPLYQLNGRKQGPVCSERGILRNSNRCSA